MLMLINPKDSLTESRTNRNGYKMKRRLLSLYCKEPQATGCTVRCIFLESHFIQTENHFHRMNTDTVKEILKEKLHGSTSTFNETILVTVLVIMYNNTLNSLSEKQPKKKQQPMRT